MLLTSFKMKEIQLSRGRVAVVDDEDFKDLSRWNWCWCPNRKGYAVRRLHLREGRGRGTVAMAREIMKAPKGMMVDHKNGNTLDNRRDNLRLATHHQNQMNTGLRITNTSGFKGVAWDKRGQAWRVMMNVKKKMTYLGRYRSKRTAAMIYDLWADDIFGEFANTNFKVVASSRRKAAA
jgi:hypothetical protein